MNKIFNEELISLRFLNIYVAASKYKTVCNKNLYYILDKKDRQEALMDVDRLHLWLFTRHTYSQEKKTLCL